MGLGGYLVWTGVIREIAKRLPKDVKILPCEGDGKRVTKLVRSPVFENNPHVYKPGDGDEAFPLFLNNPTANYCKTDTPIKAHHRYDKHMMTQMCEFYGIDDIELKCELFFTNTEKERVNKLCEDLEKNFITIEPHSKNNYTPNRAYPFEKWQNIVNNLSEKIQIVQIGTTQSKLLNNVIDLRGKTSFREAALLIGNSRLFMSTEGGLTHAATTTETPALTIITGYQHPDMVAYPQNINIDISNHDPCGLKVKCEECEQEALNHNEKEVVDKVLEYLL